MAAKIFNFFKRKPVVQSHPDISNGFPQPELPVISDMKTAKLGIIVGHEKKAPGAYVAAPIRSYEYFVNKDIAGHIKAVSESRGLKCEVILRDGINIAGAYAKAVSLGCDCVIELHFNAFNQQAFGTETLCTKSSDDRAFASIVQKHLVKLFGRVGISNRGIKALSLSDRGGFSVHSFPVGANCLVEPFFSDNPKEVELYLSVKDKYPEALVDAVIEWAKSVDLLK